MPDIVYVDDKTVELLGQATPDQRARIADFVFDDGVPDGAFEAARTANAWLFDFFLFDQGKDGDNGLGLFSRWRQRMAGHPSVILISNALQQALGEAPGASVLRHHVQAQRLGVEWIGSKDQDTLVRIVAIADATAAVREALRTAVGDEEALIETLSTEELITMILKVDRRSPWLGSAQRQIDRARPPRLSRPSSSTEVARHVVHWLISHVLPYSSFLVNDAQAALRLEVSKDSFSALANEGLPAINVCRYKGPLATFHGRRWWRAALDHWAYDIGEEEGGYRAALQRRTSVALEWLPQIEPVLVSDADLVETGEIREAADCVRAVDEDFPPNVEPAWVPVEDARQDRKLAAKVLSEDQHLIGPDE